MIFDTHAHYDDSRYDEDREEIIEEMFDSNVGCIVNVGADMLGCVDSVKLAERYEGMYASVGIHPYDAFEIADEKRIAMDGIETLRSLAKHEKVIAIGEAGLDYCAEPLDKELQKKAFVMQIELAQELGLPLIVHDREAHKDTMDILAEYPGLKAVIHCFSGSAELARQAVRMGFYVAFGGVVTFKNAKKVVEAVKEVPLDRLLVETDCPYLSPEPHRGKRNHSANISYVLEKIAELRGMDVKELEEITYQNAKAFYGIK